MKENTTLDKGLKEYYNQEYKAIFNSVDFERLDEGTIHDIKNSYGFSRWRLRKQFRELVNIIKKTFNFNK